MLFNSPTIVPKKVPKIIPIKPRKINPVIEPISAPFTPLLDPPYFFTIKDGNKLSIKLIKRLKRKVDIKNVKIMFDFYHVQISQGNVLTRFKDNFNFIGHVQMASVPERNEPIFGELNYSNILSEIYKFGYQGLSLIHI